MKLIWSPDALAVTPVASVIALTAVAIAARLELPAKLSCSVPPLPATSIVRLPPEIMPDATASYCTSASVALLATCTTTSFVEPSARRAALTCRLENALAVTELVV